MALINHGKNAPNVNRGFRAPDQEPTTRAKIDPTQDQLNIYNGSTGWTNNAEPDGDESPGKGDCR
jgi:hypothetical protein